MKNKILSVLVIALVLVGIIYSLFQFFGKEAPTSNNAIKKEELKTIPDNFVPPENKNDKGSPEGAYY